MGLELRLSVGNNFQLSLATPPESPHNPTGLVPLSPLKSNSHQALQLASSASSRRRFTFEGVENGIGSASSSCASLQDVFSRSHFSGAATPGTPEKPKIPQLLSSPHRKLLQSSSSSAAAPGTPEKPKIPQLLPSPQRNSAAAPGTPEKPKILQLLPSPQRNSAAAPSTPEKSAVAQSLSSPQKERLQPKPYSSAFPFSSAVQTQSCSSVSSSSSSSSASAAAEPTSLDEDAPSNAQMRADLQMGQAIYVQYLSYSQRVPNSYVVTRTAHAPGEPRSHQYNYSVGLQMPQGGTCIYPCQFLDDKNQKLQFPVMQMFVVSNKTPTPLLERERLIGNLPEYKHAIPHNQDLGVICFTHNFIQSYKGRNERIAIHFRELLQNIQEGDRLRNTFILTQSIRQDDGTTTLEQRNFPFIRIFNALTAMQEGYIITRNVTCEVALDKEKVFQRIRQILEMSIDPRTIAKNIFLDLTRSNVKMDPFFNVSILSLQKLDSPAPQETYVQQMIANLESLAGDNIPLWVKLVKNFHQINPGISLAVNRIVSQRAIQYSLDQEAAAMALGDD